MPYVTVGQENSSPIDLYYEDLGSGQPVVLVHGFPLSGRSWEKQTLALLQAGCRVIAYDRRGFGRSSQPTTGYDYDTFADDLHKLITKLDLRDIVLAGMSMGGGEVARYLGRYGSERVSKAAIISGVPPFLLKTADNPEGVDRSVFDGILDSIARDRLAFQSQFLANFFNTDVYLGKRVSEEVIRDCWNVAAAASPVGTAACVPTWYTDFRSDLARIDVPTLVLHGDADRIVPIAASGLKTHAAIKGSRLVVLEGAPHGLLWTHADEVNRALLELIRQPSGVRAS
ncbi:MAG TPA: alpha/beta hydrolase [Candidatus Dormibacteraeota bacterium]|nr:alpha/beta hydrolase [Candidatus Dormibacteraeota bacterium]